MLSTRSSDIIRKDRISNSIRWKYENVTGDRTRKNDLYCTEEEQNSMLQKRTNLMKLVSFEDTSNFEFKV
ncbi:unnamed protein product [Adineta ricciae]|uniref:Uncharacterized protein n=1 Tax=Adineta ricciae TaxID=249248 RepID=A0A814V658_ADIRI|nr:unnamed protein product [Adineta ricciae]